MIELFLLGVALAIPVALGWLGIKLFGPERPEYDSDGKVMPEHGHHHPDSFDPQGFPPQQK